MQKHLRAIAVAVGLCAALAASVSATDRFRVMFLYSTEAQTTLGEMKEAADSLIQNLNTVYANSGLDIVAENAGVFKTSVPQSGGLTNVQYMDNGNYANWNRGFRKDYSADIVTWMTTSTTGILGYTCGTASASTSDSAWAYTITSVAPSCASSYSFPQTVGQLMASAYQVNGTNPTVYYARGYCTGSSGYRALGMGSQPGGTCTGTTYIPYYSSPGITYSGNAMGITNTADMVRAISERIGYVKDFMEPPAVLALSATPWSGGTYTRSGSAVQANEFADAVATDSINVGSGFTIDSGAIAHFQSNRTIQLEPMEIKAGASVTMTVNGYQVFGKFAADREKGAKTGSTPVETGFHSAVLSQGMLRLDYALSEPAPVSVEIFGVDGKSLGSWKWTEMTAGARNRAIAVPGVISGMLFVKWSAGKAESTHRILVLK